MPEQSGGSTDQSTSSDVSVTQGTNHPTQVDTYVSQKGSDEHVHVATDKETGKVLYEGWGKNKSK